MLPARGYTFISLNVVRVLSIIALLLVFASSVVVMVHDIQAVNRFIAAGKNSAAGNSTVDLHLDCDYIDDSTVPNQPAGAFWAVLNRGLIMAQVIVLLLSEIGWPAKFFDRFFPVLGKDFGLGPTGVIQCLLGAAILSHHVDDFALVSAFFLFSIGCLNIVIGLIWRESAKVKRSILTWRDQAKSVLPTNVKELKLRPDFPSPYLSPSRTGSEESYKKPYEKEKSYDDEPPAKTGLGFGRQGEKAAAKDGYLLTKPVESRFNPSRKPSPSTRYNWQEAYDRTTMLSPTPTAVNNV